MAPLQVSADTVFCFNSQTHLQNTRTLTFSFSFNGKIKGNLTTSLKSISQYLFKTVQINLFLKPKTSLLKPIKFEDYKILLQPAWNQTCLQKSPKQYIFNYSYAISTLLFKILILLIHTGEFQHECINGHD